MLRSEAVARAQRILGFTTAHGTALVEQLQDAQQEFEQDAELPWFLRREISSVSTTIDEGASSR